MHVLLTLTLKSQPNTAMQIERAYRAFATPASPRATAQAPPYSTISLAVLLQVLTEVPVLELEPI